AGLLAVELVPGGGASAWGNAALGGIVQVRTESPLATASQASVMVGDFDTRSAEISHSQASGAGTLLVQARLFSTDGFSLVAPRNRGPIDIAAWSRHRWARARWTQTFANQVQLAVDVRGF